MASFFQFISELITPSNYQLNEAIKTKILDFLSAHYITEEMEKDSSMPHCESRGKLCGYAFERGDLVYRCQNCGRDPTCVFCAKCFNDEDHQGHDISYNITSSSGGCCDCGDSEAWKTTLYCKYHQISTSQDQQNEADSHPELNLNQATHLETRHPVPQSLVEILVTLFVLSFIRNQVSDEGLCLIQGLNLENKNLTSPSYCILLYNDERHNFDEVIGILMDAVDYSEEMARGLAEEVDRQGRALVYQNENYDACVEICDTIESIGLEVAIFTPLQLFLQEACFVVMNWTIQMCSEHAWLQRSLSSELFAPLSAPIHRVLASYDEGGKMRPEKMLESTTHPSTAPPMPTTNSSSTFTSSSSTIHMTPPPPSTSSHPSEIASVVPSSPPSTKLISKNVELLIRFEKYLWKEVRVSLKQLFMNTVLKSYDYKFQMGLSFSNLYSDLIYDFLHDDREPDLSILFFTVQLYTVPSLVQSLVRSQNLFPRILRAIQAGFQSERQRQTLEGFSYSGEEAIATAMMDVIQLPPHHSNDVALDSHALSSSATSATFASSSTVFNVNQAFVHNRRYFHPFQDLRYLIEGCSFEDTLNCTEALFEGFFDFYALFESMNPNKHAILEHVEYETDEWIHAFNISLQLARVAKEFSVFCSSSSESLQISLAQAIRYLLTWLQKPAQRANLESKRVVFSGGQFSFHHPLHWLFAYLLRQIFKFSKSTRLSHYLNDLMHREIEFQTNAKSEEKASQMAASTFIPIPIQTPFDLLQRLIVDPLHLQVYMSHIRGGLWVRNGNAIRHQANNYCGIQLMDDIRDQDIFLMQAFFACCPVEKADEAVAQILAPFYLKHWLQGNSYETFEQVEGMKLFHSNSNLNHAEYEKFMISSMSDFLLLFIYILSEDLSSSASPSESIQRAIHHVLFLEPLSYSELKRRLPFKYSESALLDEMIQKTTLTYKKKKNGHETELYRLDEDAKSCLVTSSIDLYYPYYSFAERQSALTLLKAKTGTGSSSSSNLKTASLDLESLHPFSKWNASPSVSLIQNERMTLLAHSKQFISILFQGFARCCCSSSTHFVADFWMIDQMFYLIYRLLRHSLDAFQDDHPCTFVTHSLYRHLYQEVYSWPDANSNASPPLIQMTFYALIEHMLNKKSPFFSENQEALVRFYGILRKCWLDCQPVHSDTIEQGSNSTTTTTTSSHHSHEELERKKRKAAAEHRRLQIMQDFAKARKDFLKTQSTDDPDHALHESAVMHESHESTIHTNHPNQDSGVMQNALFSDSNLPLQSGSNGIMKSYWHEMESSEEKEKQKEEKDFLLLPSRPAAQLPSLEGVSCLICREPLLSSSVPHPNPHSNGLLGYMGRLYGIRTHRILNSQYDRNTSTNPNPNPHQPPSTLIDPCSPTAISSDGNPVLHPNPGLGFNLQNAWQLRSGTALTTCRHLFHYRCYEASARSSAALSSPRCPLCRKKANAFIPLISPECISDTPHWSIQSPTLTLFEQRSSSEFEAAMQDYFSTIGTEGVSMLGTSVDSTLALALFPNPKVLYRRWIYYMSKYPCHASDHTIPSGSNSNFNLGSNLGHRMIRSYANQLKVTTGIEIDEAHESPSVDRDLRYTFNLFIRHICDLFYAMDAYGGRMTIDQDQDLNGISDQDQIRMEMHSQTGSQTLFSLDACSSCLAWLKGQRSALPQLMASLSSTPPSRSSPLQNSLNASYASFHGLIEMIRIYLIQSKTHDHTHASTPSISSPPSSLSLFDWFKSYWSHLFQTPITNDHNAFRFLIESCTLFFAADCPSERTLFRSLVRFIYTHHLTPCLLSHAHPYMVWCQSESEIDESYPFRKGIEAMIGSWLKGNSEKASLASLSSLTVFLVWSSESFLRKAWWLEQLYFGKEPNQKEPDRLCKNPNPSISDPNSPFCMNLLDEFSYYFTYFGWTDCLHLPFMDCPPMTSGGGFDYPFPYTLLGLPIRYDHLLQNTLKRACLNCHKVPNESALCLVCGKLCCVQSYCCVRERRGECNDHTFIGCGKSSGLFLLANKCGLLLLGDGSGFVRPAPYVDRHMETDYGFKRGSPLRLSLAMLADCRDLWLGFSVADAIDSAYEPEALLMNERIWLLM